jgi:bifunctional DNA-binding transcriptional regulator/antitoxin component of YhaV-PrlF toxin-antitoxin module
MTTLFIPSETMKTLACQKVIASNRVYLQPEIRNKLSVEEGDFLKFVEIDGKIYIEKVKPMEEGEILLFRKEAKA